MSSSTQFVSPRALASRLVRSSALPSFVFWAGVASAGGPVAVSKAKAPSASPRITESAVAHLVENRRAIGEALAFEPGDTAHALAVVENPGMPTVVEMFWKRDGELRSRVKLDVGRSKGWRTWSRHRIGAKDLGAWTVEVRAVDGTLLDELAFEVVPSMALPQVDLSHVSVR